MGIDPMADAAGQQGLSPYYAMACNPSTMTDPLGLFATGPAHEGMYPRKPGLAPVPFYYALLCMPPSKIFDMMYGSVFYAADQKMEVVLSGLYADMAAHDAVIAQRYNAIRQEIWQNAIAETAGLIADVRRHVLNGGRANYSQDGTDPAEKKRRNWSEKNSGERSVNFTFDARGDELFSRWVNGSGAPLITGAPHWVEYMKASKDLKYQLIDILENDAMTRTVSGPINIRTDIVLEENNYGTGYGLLHGTNAAVGGFEISGDAIMHGAFIHYAVIMTWNDIIDPNPQEYNDDEWMSKALKIFYSPKDYQVSIKWFDIITIKK